MHGITVALAVWAVVAPFIGIVLGHYLTRSWQREQWLRDCRKEEFRELLTSITKCYRTVLDKEDSRTLHDARSEALTVIQNRIYVAEDVKQYRILESWKDATDLYDADWSLEGLVESYKLVSALIVDIAIRDHKSPNFIKRFGRRLRGKRLLE
jgi:hypothetical protein